MTKKFRAKVFHFSVLHSVKSVSVLVGISMMLVLGSFTPVGQPKKRTWKVVIDAGHGGKDPGTIGNSTKEKDVVLPISLLVGEYLEKYGENIEVIYTRKKDVFVDLKVRTEIANKLDADLFVSIHANSLPKKTPASRKASIKGAEVYIMGAQNTARALGVAKRENSAILLEEDYEKKYDFDPKSEESYILYNLTQSAYQDNSLILASLIDEQLTKRAGRRSYGVKQSSLYVMWNTAMPSVLVETGYLSNPTEEKELSNPETQSYIASGIYRAIKEYKEAFDSQN